MALECWFRISAKNSSTIWEKASSQVAQLPEFEIFEKSAASSLRLSKAVISTRARNNRLSGSKMDDPLLHCYIFIIIIFAKSQQIPEARDKNDKCFQQHQHQQHQQQPQPQPPTKDRLHQKTPPFPFPFHAFQEAVSRFWAFPSTRSALDKAQEVMMPIQDKPQGPKRPQNKCHLFPGGTYHQPLEKTKKCQIKLDHFFLVKNQGSSVKIWCSLFFFSGWIGSPVTKLKHWGGFWGIP